MKFVDSWCRLVPKMSVLLTVLIAVFPAACVTIKPISRENDRVSATQAVDSFHQLLNQKHYEAIYEMTDEKARASKSKDLFMEILSSVSSHFGRSISTQLIKHEEIPRVDHTEVHLRMLTTFEKGEAIELFVWRVRNNVAKLDSYSMTDDR